jgi:serine/threonine protein kinase
VLTDLLIQWEDLFKQGQDTPAPVLCKEHPQLVETLARQIAALKRLAWLDKKIEDDHHEPGDDAMDESSTPKLLAGRYRLDQRIATGGFAEVWRAFDQELERIVAVKIPKRDIVGAAEAFLGEARRVARLKHPSIVPIHDVGLGNDECFFVGAYVEGGSLADRLLEGPLSAGQVCPWLIAIAEALEHAHAAGVIHRDIKPANILIDAHDRALLADFGIAQSSMQTGGAAASIGTLRYMSPEQLDGQAAIPQSDIYSVAVVLHEALTGKPPYSAGDPNTLRREIGMGATLSPNLPRRLIPVLRKALHKDPDRRFGSAAEFAWALRSGAQPSATLMPLGAVAAAGILLGFLAWRSAFAPQAGTATQPAATAPSGSPPVQKPNVVRKEMPYPLPPFNRREWRSRPPDPGKLYRFDPESGWWFEYGDDGQLNFRFRQTRVAEDAIDLEDPVRQVWLTLTATTVNVRASPTYAHAGVMASGAWVHASDSPYPPELNEPISITSPRDSLEAYIQVLTRSTGVPISLNWSAMTLEGITKNQTFPFDAKQQPARDVLQAILRKADSEGRLRAVLRGTDDGKTSIDITTKQALKEQNEPLSLH